MPKIKVMTAPPVPLPPRRYIYVEFTPTEVSEILTAYPHRSTAASEVITRLLDELRAVRAKGEI